MNSRRTGGSFRGPRQTSRITLDGFTFQAAREAQRYSELVSLQRHGRIADLNVVCKPAAKDGVRLFAGRFTYRDVGTNKPVEESTRRNKFSAVKDEVDGITFDSRREARRYRVLQLLERAGTIRNIERQIPFVIHAYGSGKPVGRYIADFRYETVSTGAVVVEDAKGFRTQTYALKKRLIEAEYGIAITEV